MRDKNFTRRQWIKTIIISIITLELLYVFYGLFRFNKKKRGKKTLFDAGDIGKFQKGRRYPFSEGNFYLSCFENGGFLALSTKCTHLGCMVQLNEDGYACPCHASSFDNFGEVLAPPATRPLDIFPITFEGNSIFVDINSPIKRSAFEDSQLFFIPK